MSDQQECRVERALTIIRGESGRGYGYWCLAGRHVWSKLDDAEKCCHPEWRRTMKMSGKGTWTHVGGKKNPNQEETPDENET